MPFNLLKRYNDLLDLDALNSPERRASLMGIFNRDIALNSNFSFKSKQIQPTSKAGEIPMQTLFSHLTTEITSRETRQREFEPNRSKRLHWIKFHINEGKLTDMLHFSVEEPEGIRTYIYDQIERYVIVLQPLRKVNEYYLLTAYFLIGKDIKRDKIMQKFKRRTTTLL